MTPTFLVVVLDGGRDTTPLLVADVLLVVVFGFCTGTRGFIGLTCDVVVLETTCFLGETAFAVAVDLTGRAVNVGFVTGRGATIGRAVVVLVVNAAVPTVVADRVGLVAEKAVVRVLEATFGRILVVTAPREEAAG